MKAYSTNDYVSALRSLAPQGLAWDWAPDSHMHAVLRGLAHNYQSSDNSAVQLLEGAFPKTASVLLSEWESTLGLPDDCAIGEMDSITKRQGAVVSKLIASGGQSKRYFIELAAEMGYTIEITEFRLARAGLSACGDALNGDDWRFVWRINAGSTTTLKAQAGISYCGDPLRSWGGRYLQCKFTHISPPHTILQVGYDQ